MGNHPSLSGHPQRHHVSVMACECCEVFGGAHPIPVQKSKSGGGKKLN